MKTEWVLITGASSGIGTELARVFARHDYPLVLLGRNEARLNQLAQELSATHRVSVKTLSKDLSVPGAASEIFATVQRESVPISILINNAGFGLAGRFAEKDLRTYRQMIEVNVTALVELTHLFLQPMLARRSGRILNVASTAAFQPGPMMAVYYASKSFVFAFSYALADELKGTGVTVTTLCPGATRTEFFKRAENTNSEKWVEKWMMQPQKVAELGYKGLMRGKRVVIPGFLNKLGAVMAKRLPTIVPTKIARKVVGKG